MGYHNVVKGRVGAPEAGETDFDDHVAGLSWAGAIRGTEYGVGGCCGRRKDFGDGLSGGMGSLARVSGTGESSKNSGWAVLGSVRQIGAGAEVVRGRMHCPTRPL